MISLAYAVSCSSTLPLLILALYWSGLTTRAPSREGDRARRRDRPDGSRPAGLVKVLGNAAPIFPIDPPTIVTMPLAFLTAFRGLGDGPQVRARGGDVPAT